MPDLNPLRVGGQVLPVRSKSLARTPQAPKLRYSDLTGAIYCVTRYTEHPDKGMLEAKAKLDVTEQFWTLVHQLDAADERWSWWCVERFDDDQYQGWCGHRHIYLDQALACRRAMRRSFPQNGLEVITFSERASRENARWGSNCD